MRRMTTMLFALSVVTQPALAQTSQPGSEEEAIIRSLEQRVTASVLNRDTAALGSLWSEHFMVNSPRNIIAPDRKTVFDLMNRGIIHYSSFESSVEQLRVHGDIAIVMGRETVQPTGKAPHAGKTVKRRFTHVWQKVGDQWQVIARHANIIVRPGS